jgi:MFS family permease
VRVAANASQALPTREVLTSRRTATVVSLGLAGSAMSLLHTLVVPLLPELPELLDASIPATSWVATATLVAGGVSVPIVGRMGDMYGKRGMILVCLVFAFTGSLVAAMSNSLPILLVGRTVQGLSIGVIPLSISLLRDLLPAAELGRGVAILNGLTLSLGTGFGPLLMGGVLDEFGWHAVFWVVTVLSGLSFLLVVALVDDSLVRTPARFDFPGAVGLSVAIVLLLLAITRGGDWGWTSPIILALLVAFGAVTAVWVGWERRRPDPLVDLSVTLHRPVLITHLAGVTVGFTVFLQYIVAFTLVSLSIDTGHGFGRSMLVAGATQIPGAIAIVLAAPVAARLARRRGAPALLGIGCSAAAVGFAVGAVWHAALWHIALSATFIYGGVGLAYCALPMLVMANVPVTETAAANSVNNLSRVIGSVLSAAVASAILAASLESFPSGRYPAEWAFVAIYVTGIVFAAGTALLARALPRSATAAQRPGRRRP